MARVKENLREMLDAQRIPEGVEFTWEVVSIRPTDSGWELAQCRIVDAEDQAQVGRSESMILCHEEQGRMEGVSDLMSALGWEEMMEDENGEQTTFAFKGQQFKGTVRYRNGRGSVRPLRDFEFLNRLEASSDGATRGGKKKKGGRKKTTSRSTGRSRSRSRSRH